MNVSIEEKSTEVVNDMVSAVGKILPAKRAPPEKEFYAEYGH